jgi:hypothetical protein
VQRRGGLHYGVQLGIGKAHGARLVVRHDDSLCGMNWKRLNSAAPVSRWPKGAHIVSTLSRFLGDRL